MLVTIAVGRPVLAKHSKTRSRCSTGFSQYDDQYYYTPAAYMGWHEKFCDACMASELGGHYEPDSASDIDGINDSDDENREDADTSDEDK